MAYGGMDTKKCYKCKETKPRECFLRSSRIKDGMRGECRDCGREIKKAQNKYSLLSPERKKKIKSRPAYLRYRQSEKYKVSQREKHKQRIKKRMQEDPVFREKMLLKMKQKLQGSKTPEKVRARRKLGKAVKAGKIQRQPCPCGNPKSHGHHEDYSKPLEVTWLCASCHGKLHWQKHLQQQKELAALSIKPD